MMLPPISGMVEVTSHYLVIASIQSVRLYMSWQIASNLDNFSHNAYYAHDARVNLVKPAL